MNSKKLQKEPKQKQSNNPINSINPINAINIKSKKKETFDSETCENSNSNSENIKIKKQYKRSVDFYPKQMEIEEIDEDITIRRNTISKFGKIKNFVPQLKPIKIDIIPSKLRLNRMGFKDLKCNKDNKFLLYSNKYFISCPNIQDEEDNDELDNLRFYEKKGMNLSSEIFNENNKNEDMHQIRKNLQKTKNKNIPKVCSMDNPSSKNNKFNNELNFGCSSDSDLYDIDSINNSINENTEDNFKNEFVNNKEEECNGNKRDRYYSWSILDVLQQKNKQDKK